MTEAASSSAFSADLLRYADPAAGRAPLWLRRLRERAAGRAAEMGLPSPRREAWRHTDVSPVGRAGFRPASGRREVPNLPSWADLGCPRVVVANGQPLASAMALPEGIRVEALSALIRSEPEKVQPHLGRAAGVDGGFFAALNTAYLHDGVAIFADRSAGPATIHVVHAASPADPGAAPGMVHPRVLIVAGEESRLTVVETFFSTADGPHLTNAVTEAFVEHGASLRHVRLQDEGAGTYHLGTLSVRQGKAGRFSSHHASLGGALSRLDLRSVLEGEGADGLLHGLHLAGGTRHVDSHTVLDHAVPGCTSREEYKAILWGAAVSVFEGRVVVRPGAQKTDARQSNRNLLLDRDATVHTRPQLEIYADDVRCTHGAAIGRLDPEAIFYLRSRGMDAGEARRILIRAFAAEVVERIPVAPLRERLETLVEERLPAI